jgi:hypothetical protein
MTLRISPSPADMISFEARDLAAVGFAAPFAGT